MKKKGIILLTLLAALLLGGCTKKADEENEYTVYYVNTEGTRLTEDRYMPVAATFDELMAELLDKLKQPPSGEASALKSGVTVEGYDSGRSKGHDHSRVRAAAGCGGTAGAGDGCIILY